VRSIRVVIVLIILVFTLSPAVFAQLSPDLASPNIVINLPSKTLELYSNTNLIKVYPIAIGKPSTPSPLGNFKIINKEVNPSWIHPQSGNVVISGPDNPLGYRWMEFYPLYGIHGTNAPWTIGSAVSNGCIRMQEENVEELFEVVPYGTPVQITYDRVKVRTDGNGELSIGIYPDIYGGHELSLNEVKTKLMSYGVGDFLRDNELIEIMNAGTGHQTVFARFHKIRVNRKTLSDRAVTYKDALYVPVRPVAIALGINIIWDDQNGMVRCNKQTVPGRLINNQLFVTGENARVLFGGQQTWIPEENVYDVDAVTVSINSRVVTSDVHMLDGILAVPMIPLADAIDQKVIRHLDGDYWLQGRKVPVSLIADIPYIQITKIYDVFQAYVYWNQEARSIELTYPFR